MRSLSFALLLAALGCAAPLDGDGLDPAAQLERAGAKLTRDTSTPGKPVVGVFFTGNKVSDDDLLPLVGMPGVKDLNLFWCEKVTAAGAKHVVGLKNLEVLGLNNSGLDDAGLAQLKGLTKLRALRLSGSIRLRDKSAETINGFAALEELSLPSSFTGAGVRQLTKLGNVKDLYLGGITTLTDTEIKFLAEAMPKLEALELGSTGIGTQITDEAIPHFAKMKNLKKLGVTGSQITPAGLKKLGAELPNCNVTKEERKFEPPPLLPPARNP